MVFLIGSLTNFAAFYFAPSNVLAPVESVQLVSNTLFAMWRGATVTWNQWFGLVLAVGGTCSSVLVANSPEVQLSIREMERLYLNPVYMTFLAVELASIFVLYFVYKSMHRRNENGEDLEGRMQVVYALWSALWGTQSVVHAKVCAKILFGGEAFWCWFFYVSVILWVITVAVWVLRLNECVEKFNPTTILPLMQSCFIGLATISGGLFFQEFVSFTVWTWALFGGSLAVMYLGVYLLTPKGSVKDEEKRILDYIANCAFVDYVGPQEEAKFILTSASADTIVRMTKLRALADLLAEGECPEPEEFNRTLKELQLPPI